SVVATGIDRTAGAMAQKTYEAPAARPIMRPAAAIAPAPVPARPVVAQAPKAADPVAETIRSAEAEMERELEIAMARQMAPAPAAAPAQSEFRPQSKLFTAPAPAAPQQPVVREPVAAPAPVMSRPVAPVEAAPVRVEPVAQPVRQTVEQVRMPKVEDFPPVVRAEMDHRASAAPAPQDERGPMGLLKRITSSLGRHHEEEPVNADMTASAPAAASQQRRPLSPEASLYAPRRGQLDDQGRTVPQTRVAHEDDQLEIPAFLRRQSN
ncbi:MAG TPA: cell division protein FtsZ, partial [Rhizobium sp.]|nr:cell division protein FtsZ [Rhizobium sp.]